MDGWMRKFDALELGVEFAYYKENMLHGYYIVKNIDKSIRSERWWQEDKFVGLHTLTKYLPQK